jgi:imidazolonepropionase-like amidohydrolase
MHGLSTHWEMWALQKGGLSALEVIRAATLHGAEAIGYDRDLGSIANGKVADMLILDKNPLEDIRNSAAIRFVMKGGELFDGDTLEQVWPVKRHGVSPWWEMDQSRSTSTANRP